MNKTTGKNRRMLTKTKISEHIRNAISSYVFKNSLSVADFAKQIKVSTATAYNWLTKEEISIHVANMKTLMSLIPEIKDAMKADENPCADTVFDKITSAIILADIPADKKAELITAVHKAMEKQ